MTSHNCRYNAGIDDSQAGNPVNPEFGVHNTGFFAWAHLASAYKVAQGRCNLANNAGPVVITVEFQMSTTRKGDRK